MRVQSTACLLQAPDDLFQFLPARATELPSATDFLQHCAFGRFVAVEFEAKRAQARSFEPTLHDFECSQLFRNESTFFPSSTAVAMRFVMD